jgi:hypothetical protein
MGQLMVFTVYPTHEACAELGRRSGLGLGRPYSRQRLAQLIKAHLPCAEKIGGQYFLREVEIEYLAGRIQTEKRKKADRH